MFATALAMSLMLTPAPQDPQTHRQAVTCTGVFLYASVLTAQAVEADPSPENQEMAETAGLLLKAADADRLAAAAREGISTDASGLALGAWLDANVEDADATMNRELDTCLAVYGYAVI